MAGITEQPKAPDVPAATGGSLPETYRPLSMLAATGFGLAVLFAVLVVVGGVLAYFLRSPWLMPLWTFLLPVLGALLSWLARVRIRNSEGTLSGQALTSWGVGLSLVFGLSYAAYVAAMAMAIRQQADSFARQWLDEVRQGQLEKAFWYTQRPPRPHLAGSALRNVLELRFNSPPDLTTPGPYTQFTQSDYVRMLQAAGAQAQIELVSVNGWDYEKGGFQVDLTYHITTPMASFNLAVGVHGSESPAGEFKGRQWYVIEKLTGIPDNKGSRISLSAEGQALLGLYAEAQELGLRWGHSLTQGDLFQAFLLTCPAGDRERLAVAQQSALVAGLITGLPANSDVQDLLSRSSEFAAGGSIRAGKDQFWAVTPEKHDEIATEVRRVFQGVRSCRVVPPRARHMPVWTRDGDWLRFAQNVQFMLPQPEPKLPFLVEAQVIVGARVDQGKPAWRIEALELLRGRVANPAPPRRP